MIALAARLRVTLLCSLAGCSGDAKPLRAPPPLPAAPVAVAPPAALAVPPEGPTKPRLTAPKPTTAPASSKTKQKTTGAAYIPPAPAPLPAPVPVPPPSRVPVAAAPATPAIARTTTRVNVPRTEHVHVEIPSGLQADLDADPRMQPWVERVIAIADSCHAQSRAVTGALQALITMHENDRPDADVRGLPAQLGGIVACATGSLMRTKMPLFTGREGTRYTVRIVFE